LETPRVETFNSGVSHYDSGGIQRNSTPDTSLPNH
jgi:hypothetical protein